MPRAATGRRLRSRAAAVLCALCALAGPLRRTAAEDFGEAAAARSGVYAARLPAFNTHIPPPGVPMDPALLPAQPPPSVAAAGAGDWGNGVCKGGVWEEGANAALETGSVLPVVQCWRKPPCLRWNYATPARCKAWPNDDQWPTADPHLPSDPPGQRSMKELLDTHWKDKTVVFVGDSINNLIYHAAVCEAAKVYDLSMGAHPGATAAADPGDLHVRLAAFHHTLNELRAKDAAMGGQLWQGGPPEMPQAVAQSRTLLVCKGWHKWKESDMEGIMAIADVIVVNYGLHYQGNVSEFDEAMPLMMKQLHEFASRPGKAALFRETGVEHKNVNENTPEGTFLDSEPGHPDATKVRGCQCGPRPESEAPLGKALNAVVAGLQSSYARVGTAPFFALTAPRHDLHEAGYCAFEGLRGKKPEADPPYCCDCTHYCYTPQFWKAFFSGVFEAHEAIGAAPAV